MYCRYSGKVQYRSRTEAAHKVRESWGSPSNRGQRDSQRRTKSQGRLETYLCPKCHKWHVGHGTKRPAVVPQVELEDDFEPVA